MGRTSLRPTLGALALALPPLVIGAATAVALLLAVVSGGAPLWPRTSLTPPEALSTGDSAAFMRLAQAGADTSARDTVRAGLREHIEIVITPLEVAVDTQEERTLKTALKYGAVVDAEATRSAVCLAHRKAPHLLPLLKARGLPDVDPATCLPPQR